MATDVVGTTQKAVLTLLADNPAGLHVQVLTEAIFGPGFTESERASLARSVRSLEKRGLVVTWWEHINIYLDGRHLEAGKWCRLSDQGGLGT